MFQRTLVSKDVLQKKDTMVKKVEEHFTLYTPLFIFHYILVHNGSEKFFNKYVLLNLDLFSTLAMTDKIMKLLEKSS